MTYFGEYVVPAHSDSFYNLGQIPSSRVNNMVCFQFYILTLMISECIYQETNSIHTA